MPTPILADPVVALNLSDASIHDGDMAQRLGFRGAAVGGTTHLDCFVPALLEAFGNAWFERGALSLYFENVVVSGEPVRACVDRPAPGQQQVDVWAERADRADFLVARGSASLGDHSASNLRTRDLRLADPSALRMLQGVQPGTAMGELVRSVSSAEQRAGIASGVINRALPWYTERSPWGDAIACPSQVAWLLLGPAYGPNGTFLTTLTDRVGSTASMYGAAEVAFVNGPVFVDRPYRVSGRVVGVGQSPKTEYLWWDSTAVDESGREVARLRNLFRIIKAASPLYPELSA